MHIHTIVRMKQVNITAKRTAKDCKEINLGNGLRKLFTSKRQANQFIADTNRFLTKMLVVLNTVYVDAFREYRAIWFVASNNKTGTRTNYMDEQTKIKSMLQAADTMFDKFNSSAWGSNDPYFSFIDIKKASLFLQEALEVMEDFNRRRNLTAAMYNCLVLRERCLAVKALLEAYGK